MVAPRTIVGFVLTVVAAFLLLAVVYAARAILVQLVLAIVLAMAAEPLVRLLERRLGRNAAVGVTFAVVASLLIGFAYVLVAPILERTRQLVHDAPQLLEDLKAGRGPLGFLETTSMSSNASSRQSTRTRELPPLRR
jgi:predicted PurR-regulated permease PerM